MIRTPAPEIPRTAARRAIFAASGYFPASSLKVTNSTFCFFSS